MRNKWKDWVAFQALEQRYGTFTAIAMMKDAGKWVVCRYRRLWQGV